ncbi:Heterokaryon incompatibility protein 6, OR allele [Fulvia fulva]|uniref:Heterokaryon incompatibility protein 6, OR allele n=1 Tax=Passalora fulva TaxID=5499 RepID=A0A9Q8L791_PASFU|nr:Heterokaryon incompatibility protein 6, OR allele [Fulvia fulva]KAK4635587.1 Heterokaryon incompatibility protein 6, OR allele [Fulvia fulva]KAK4637871.1 Heterokaryon incompatibility protein 6, OR allele [Fulvia fulva]UJO11498.1 Heterokaryon incompatibility protein 6, OR allele [Fulvia fulva]WPV09511.1 Heterokaryon incompatibility protein 6, OR allele [Fulvia fulva]WPV24982.1 Heterokaryon incompatibility protein 6, OR allele [Fulvia fulva]
MSVYKPLDSKLRQIRVLELLAGSGTDIVEGRLHVTSLPSSKTITSWLLPERMHNIGAYSDLDVLDTVLKANPGIATTKPGHDSIVAGLLQSAQQLASGLRIGNGQCHDSSAKEKVTKTLKALQTVQEIQNQSVCPSESREDKLSSIQKLWNLEMDLRSQYHPRIAYESVSYCWGESTATASMELDSIIIDAPTGTVDVLRSLRRPDAARMLWIDAICINQSDLDERMQQVMLMSDIYRSASRTIIWLGTDDTQTSHALEICATVRQQLPENILGKDADQRKAILQQAKLDEDQDVRSLDAIFGRAWFYRQWVLQEVVTSKLNTCYIGDKEFDWLDLELVADWVFWNRQWTVMRGHLPQIPRTTLYIRLGGPIFNSLHSLAIKSRELRTSEPRDKIFALLSMTSWAENGTLPPTIASLDYHLPIMTCMCLATRAMIEEDRNLSVLVRAEVERDSLAGDGTRDEDWPSWCPPWHISQVEDLSTIEALRSEYEDLAKNDSVNWRDLKPSPNPHRLVVEGKIIDTVDMAADAAAVVRSLAATSEDVHSRETADPDVDELASSLPRVMTSNQFQVFLSGLAPRPEGCAREEGWGLMRADMKQEKPMTPWWSAQKLADGICSATREEALVATCRGRRLFRTAAGQIGIGSKRIRKNDRIVTLAGSSQLFVLSPRDDHYLSRGPCTMQTMSKEPAATAEFVTLALETFKLR